MKISIARLLLCIFLILSVVSILSRIAMGITISNYMKTQVQKQAKIATEIFKKRIDGEIEKLDAIVSIPVQNKLSDKTPDGITDGPFYNCPITGNYTTEIDGTFVQNYKNRYHVIFNSEGDMVIYSISQSEDDQCVTYFKVPKDELETYFGVNLSGEGWSLRIAEKKDDGAVTIPFYSNGQSIYRHGIEEDDVTVWLDKIDGNEFYFFSAEIAGTPFEVNGYAPKEEIEEGIPAVKYTFAATLCLLMGAIFAAFIALYKMHAKSHKYAELKKEREIAEASDKAKSEFLSQVSHEIRTPLNAMVGMNELIIRECSDLVIVDYAKKARDAGSTLLCLVNDILDFSKIEAGGMKIIEEPYLLSDVIRTVDNTIRTKAEDKGLTLTIRVNENIPNNLIGDKTRVTQILLNILTNAVKYTDAGSIDAELDYAQIGGYITIRFMVTDTGIGIKQENIPILFEKFQRVDANSAIEGTGLGLSITKDLTKRMGGDISVTSTYGEGSTFTCWFKQTMEENATAYKNKEKKADGKALYAPEVSILAVDDTELNLTLLRGLLKNTGITLDTASSGEECIVMVQKKTYDIILLDIRMPGMSGEETFGRLQRQHLLYDAKVVAVTANTSNADDYADFAGFLPKPFRPAELYEMIIKLTQKAKYVDVKQPEKNTDISRFERIEGIYITHGMSMCGDESIYAEALENYAKYAESNCRALRDAYIELDYDSLARIAHTIKGSSDMIGALDLAKEAKILETAGDNKDKLTINNNISSVLTNYKHLAEDISSRIEKEKYRGEIEEKDVPGIAKHMEEYIDDFNDEAIGSMLRALSQYAWPEQYKNRFQELQKANLAADWIQMKEIVSSMRGE